MLPTPAGIFWKRPSASSPVAAQCPRDRPVRKVRTPQEISKPTPPAEMTPPCGVEGGDAADGEAVAPVGVGHGVGAFDDAGQGGDVADLLGDLVVHAGDQVLGGVDYAIDVHLAGAFDEPGGIASAFDEFSIHNRCPNSNIHHALCDPVTVRPLPDLQHQIGCGLGLDGRFVPLGVDGLAEAGRGQRAIADGHGKSREEPVVGGHLDRSGR